MASGEPLTFECSYEPAPLLKNITGGVEADFLSESARWGKCKAESGVEFRIEGTETLKSASGELEAS